MIFYKLHSDTNCSPFEKLIIYLLALYADFNTCCKLSPTKLTENVDWDQCKQRNDKKTNFFSSNGGLYLQVKRI